MNPPDPMLKYQLIVLILTLLVITWYTLETYFIRLESNRQAILTPSSKLWDRQNELDRLAVVKPEVVNAFRQMANRKEPYFKASEDVVPRDDLYIQLKAYAYLQLNFFEEIYITTSMSKGVAKKFAREDWESFIFQYMHHALLREVFNDEMNRAYTGEFVTFMTSNKHKWQLNSADSDLF
jgi:hypothetical protein